MVKSPKKPKPKPKPEEIETEPDAWERFERTVRRMLNTPPMPHKPAKQKQKPTAKRPTRKARTT